VLRRSCPKLDSRELVRSTGHRMPRVSGFLVLASPLRLLLAQTERKGATSRCLITIAGGVP
jgi:hypothetical protein